MGMARCQHQQGFGDALFERLFGIAVADHVIQHGAHIGPPAFRCKAEAAHAFMAAEQSQLQEQFAERRIEMATFEQLLRPSATFVAEQRAHIADLDAGLEAQCRQHEREIAETEGTQDQR